MIVFPVLIPDQNFLFPGTGNLKGEGKFEACIPGDHGKRELTLTPAKCCKLTLQLQVQILTVHISRGFLGISTTKS